MKDGYRTTWDYATKRVRARRHKCAIIARRFYKFRRSREAAIDMLAWQQLDPEGTPARRCGAVPRRFLMRMASNGLFLAASFRRGCVHESYSTFLRAPWLFKCHAALVSVANW